MKNFFIPAVLLLVMFLMHCGTNSTVPDEKHPVSNTAISVDSAGALLEQFSVTATSGATLTIDSGTTVLILDSSDMYMPVSARSTVLVTLDDGDAGARISITGIVTIAQFRISATVDGKAAELRFVSNTASAIVGAPSTGAHWTATLTDTAIHAGTRINLFRISGNTAILIGSQIIGVPVRPLAKKSAGSGQQTSVSPDGTGSYQAGADNGASSPPQATMPASGVYWNTYSSIPDTSYDIDSVTFGGPLTVQRCRVDELSTGDIVAEFAFAAGVTCATWTDPNDGAQYWCELTQDANGKTTSIKVAATVANIFALGLDLVRASDRLPIFSAGAYPDGDGVHAPDGSVLPDPYQDASLKFGGSKLFNFLTKDRSQGEKIEGKVRGAGYDISSVYFAKNIYRFYVSQTLDGRKKVEDDILRREGWLPVQGSETWRSRGLYDHNDTLYINIASHGSGDKVNQMVQTVSGTFTNANNDPDTVQRMNVAWTALGPMDSIPATLGSGGTSFSVACSLHTGDNVFIFQPYVNDQYGRLSYQTHMVVTSKGVKVNPFILNYKERRAGLLTVHAVTTTRSKEPDTSIAVDDITTTANLTMTPEQIVLSSIKNSASSASTCASSQTCSILSGVSDSDQTVTVTEQYQIRSHWDCERDKPIMEMGHWNGTMSFSHYGMARVYATLLPPGTGSTRYYGLIVNVAATLDMMSTPNKAGKGQVWSCPDSAWKDQSTDIWPHVSLTKSDDPVLLQFGNSATLEGYVEAPTGSASWSFHGTKYSGDSMTVTEYDATLSVGP